jgi:hypothetical protein
MQTNGSFSLEQFATLQTVFTFLEAVTIHLETDSRATSEIDWEITNAVRELGLHCTYRMLTVFPPIAVWRALGVNNEARHCA